MDITPIALAAATILANKSAETFAVEAGKGLWNAVKDLGSAIAARFSGDDEATAALQHVQEAPAADDARTALATIIQTRMERDPAFATRIAEIVGRVQDDPAGAQFATSVRDNASVGKIVNVGSIKGDVSF